HDGESIQSSLRVDHRFTYSYLRRQRIQTILVRLVRLEIEWIGGIKRRIMLGPALIQKQVQPLIGSNFVVMVALWTDLKIGLKVLFPERLLAAVSFNP